ncbi:MAG: serine/threonine protein kinase [Fimbriimonadaceae bacterium]|nr:serine/threonine protein kinase [Fimbriimonadaceae bacterium]
MSEEKDPTANYAFDPLTGDPSSRWGRRGSEGREPVPEIAGYAFRDKLGEGGMASVWTAMYVPLNQLRAVKVLTPELAQDRDFVTRFSQEAKALGRLEHPAIVKVYDANAEHVPPYIAMQWVEGKTLAERLKAGPLAPNEAIPLFEQLAAGLDYAHKLGFTHRDIKPSNVMITPAGKALLIDFGVASMLGNDHGDGHTLTGTTRYLSPEVVSGRMATAASDLWSFAVMIYRSLAGHLPFDDPNPDSVLRKIAHDAPAAPRNVSPRVRAFLLKALDKDPKQRFASATEMVSELRRAAVPISLPIGKEGFRLGLAATLFAVVVVVAGGLGAYLVVAGQNKAAPVFVANPTPAESPAPVALAPRTAAPPPTEAIDPRVTEAKGVWYGACGDDKYLEGFLDPLGGPRFRFVANVRSTGGLIPVEAEGEFIDAGRTFSVKGPDGFAFNGDLSEDGSRLSGDLALGQNPNRALFTRGEDLPTTPYDNAERGYGFDVPKGWTFTESLDGDASRLLVAPVGYPGVQVLVLVAPDPQGSTVASVLEARAAALSEHGRYDRQATNPNAALGDRKAVQWDFLYRPTEGRTVQGSAVALLRGTTSLLFEVTMPVGEERVWAAPVERLRRSFRYKDALD